MRAAGLAVALALGGMRSAAAEGLPLPDLGNHRWKHRVVVIDTPDSASPDYQTQAAALLTVWAGLLERDLFIVTQIKPAAAFRVRLVGKDGGVKFDSAKPISSDALFALIDAMPMRREEAAAKKEPAVKPRL